MATAATLARRRQHEILQTATQANAALPDTVGRNKSLVDVFQSLQAGAARAYLQVVDSDRRILDTMLGVDGQGEDEIGLVTTIEWIVCDPNEASREAVYDAGIEAIGAAVLASRDDPLWDRLEVIGFNEDNLTTGPLPFVTAAQITLEITLTSESLFGLAKR